MKHCIALILLLVLMVGCAPEPAPITEPTMTASPIPATATFTPSPVPPTETLTPFPTPLPGKLVYPIDTLGNSIPWLPVDENARPAVHSIFFNTQLPPFNSALVRRAFAHAIDRQVIYEMAAKYKAREPSPATTFTPAKALGRDLYNDVGAQFDAVKAKELLTEAGYADPSAFPVVTIIVNAYGDIAPGARFNMATVMTEMWKTHLGVTVKVEVIQSFQDYGNRVQTNPPEMFWNGWVNENDPDAFLRGIFHSRSEYNYGRFSNPEFDNLVIQAATSREPLERQELYIQAERILCETEAALIPLYNLTWP
jgi:ABC-type transport system substrate-binding protein